MPRRFSSNRICSRNFLGIAWLREISEIISGVSGRARQSATSARRAYLAFCEISPDMPQSRSSRSAYSGNTPKGRALRLLLGGLSRVGLEPCWLGTTPRTGRGPPAEGRARRGRGTSGRGGRRSWGRRLDLRRRRHELGREKGR